MVRCKGDRQDHAQLRIAWVGKQQKKIEIFGISGKLRGEIRSTLCLLGRDGTLQEDGDGTKKIMSCDCISGEVD